MKKKKITTKCPCGYITTEEIILKSSPANSPFPPKVDALTGLVIKKSGGNYATERRMVDGDENFIIMKLLSEFYPHAKEVNQREYLKFLCCPKCGTVLFPGIAQETKIIDDESAAEE